MSAKVKISTLSIYIYCAAGGIPAAMMSAKVLILLFIWDMTNLFVGHETFKCGT